MPPNDPFEMLKRRNAVDVSRRLFASSEGAAVVEYALLAALIAVGLVAGASQIDPGFTQLVASISAATGTGQ